MVAILSLAQAAERVGRSIRTLRRWQSKGLLRVLPGGYIMERELIVAERAVRERHLLKKYEGWFEE